MTWAVVRLKPLASRPSKQDERISNIEYALRQAGIRHYLPLERKEIIHHRSKMPLDKKYPLIPGYAFVCGVTDWYALSRCDFVGSVLGVRGSPLRLPAAAIDKIRDAEGEILYEYERTKAERRRRELEALERVSQSKARRMFPAGSPVVVSSGHYALGGMRGHVVAATGRQTIRAMIETLNGVISAELPIAALEMVA